MTENAKKISALQRKITMLANLAKSADVISCDLRLSGSLLVDNGEKLDYLADKLSMPTAFEPYADESGEITGVFKIIQIDGAEIMCFEDAGT